MKRKKRAVKLLPDVHDNEQLNTGMIVNEPHQNREFDGQCKNRENTKSDYNNSKEKTWQDSLLKLERVENCDGAKLFQESNESSDGGDEDSTETSLDLSGEDSYLFGDDECETSEENLQAMMKTISKADDLIAMLDSKPDRQMSTDISSVEKLVVSNKTDAVNNSLSMELNRNILDEISTAVQSTSPEYGSRKRGNESLDTDGNQDGKVVFKRLLAKEDPVDGYGIKHVCGTTSNGQSSIEPTRFSLPPESSTSERASTNLASSPTIDPQVKHSLAYTELRGDEVPPSSGVGNSYEVAINLLVQLIISINNICINNNV